MKKTLLAVVVALLLCLQAVPASAASEVAIPQTISEDVVAPASEETVWCTRVYNGMLQRRLWSITYGEWLTDWIDVEYVG